MNKKIQSLLCAVALALVLGGCGNDDDANFVVTGTGQVGVSDQELIDQAAVANPEIALKLVPYAHLDPLKPLNSVALQGEGGVQFTSVADLEANYETLFGSLSQKYSVTLASPENVSNIAFIKGQSGTGNFDLNAQPILNNPLGVTGVSFQAVDYQTTVPLPDGPQTFNVSGGLLMPTGIDKSKIKGVVVYFHGTTFSKDAVGSNYSDGETQLCAQVFASQGYIVALPDYVGQGVDWANVHPYVLYPKVSAQTAADMLAAIKPTVADNYGFLDTDSALKLFSVGYSEGGAYSLWFNSYLSSDPSLLDDFYLLTHSVGLEGAYSTSEVTYGYLFDNVGIDNGNPYNIQSLSLVNIVKPILSADAFLSYATYSNSSDFSAVFNPSFFAMNATLPVPQKDCNVDGVQVSIDQAFARPSTDIANELVASGLGKSANGFRYPGPTQLTKSTENGISSLVSEEILMPGPLADLQAVLQDADVDLTACADNGVSIVTLDQDSVVVPNNFDLLSSEFPTKLATAIKIDHTQLKYVSPFSETVGYAYWAPIDHLQGPVYELLYALNTFNQY